MLGLRCARAGSQPWRVKACNRRLVPHLPSCIMDAGLFKQYEADYCTKSTELSKTIENLAALSAGAGRWRDSSDIQ